jgi:hypothetical protein
MRDDTVTVVICVNLVWIIKKNQFLDLLCAVYFACDCFSGSVSGTAVARQGLALLGLATAARFLSDFIFLALVFSRTSGLRARLYEDRFLLPWNLFLAAIHFGADIPTLLFPFRVRIGPPARRFRCLLDFPAQLASPRSWISDFVAALDPAKRAPGSSFLTRIFGPPARSRADFSSCFIDFRSVLLARSWIFRLRLGLQSAFPVAPLEWFSRLFLDSAAEVLLWSLRQGLVGQSCFSFLQPVKKILPV